LETGDTTANIHLQLAMATLGATFAGAYLSMGGKKTEAANTPPINAKSKEEESFVK
jgi:F-type H+-transporting ATPase subunit k